MNADSPNPTKGDSTKAHVQLVLDNAFLFHDQFHEPYAQITRADMHKEIWACKSKKFRLWVTRLIYGSTKKPPSSETLKTVIGTIEGLACCEGPQISLANRVTFHEGAIWIDLADARWRAVKVTEEGWTIVSEPPILFRRYSHHLAQVEPKRGGNIQALFRFLNLSPDQQILLLAYMVACFFEDIVHPVLAPYGPKGAAKTSLCVMVRSLVDPSHIEKMALPSNRDELLQNLNHHWNPLYDNLSRIPDWASDILCRACTGEGASKRQLYTDSEDVLMKFRRCVMVNGINVVARKPDLLDRTLLIELTEISDDQRLSEQELRAGFDLERPYILGAILDLVVAVMRILPTLRPRSLPRLADFVRIGCAVAKALGKHEEDFIAAFERNRARQTEEALSASPVGTAVRALMKGRTEWQGLATQLLKDLKEVADSVGINVRGPGWPTAPNSLTRKLNEIVIDLRKIGIHYSVDRTVDGAEVTLRCTQGSSENIVNTVNGHESACLEDNPPDDIDDSDDDLRSTQGDPDDRI